MLRYFDASVLVSTLVDEERSRMAFDLATASRARVTTDFALAEVSSAIARRVRSRDLTGQEGLAHLEGLDAMRGRWIDVRPILPADIREAELLVRRPDLKLRVPDAIHLAAAIRLDAALLTFDAGLAEAARTLRRPVLGA